MDKWSKMRGENMQVISIMLLKTNVEKMPENRPSIMLLKRSLLWPPFHYVDETKGSY
jgi:hypothetical protein